jgi:hypothetical protein
MKLPTKSPVKRGNTRLSHGTRRTFEPQALRSERWMKQREMLLRLREELSERIRQLAVGACEEIPSYSLHMADAATDSFDRDLTLAWCRLSRRRSTKLTQR